MAVVAAAPVRAAVLRDPASARRPRRIGQVTFSISYVVVIVRGRLALDRAGVRGGGARPRRVAARRAAAGAAAAARPGDLREPDGGVRAVDRRLRRHRATCRERRRHGDGADQALLERARHADAGAERARDGDGRAITLLTLALAYLVYRRFSAVTGGPASSAIGGSWRRRGMNAGGRIELVGAAQAVRRRGRPSTGSTWTSPAASSSRWSARRAAARRRRCG